MKGPFAACNEKDISISMFVFLLLCCRQRSEVERHCRQERLCSLKPVFPAMLTFSQIRQEPHITAATAATGAFTFAAAAAAPTLLLQVNARIQLTADQVAQLQLAYQQFWRLLGKVQGKQQQLVQAIAESANLAEQQQRQSLAASIPGSAAAATAVTAAVRNRELLEKLLTQHMAGWTAAAGLLLQFYCNTLTRLQIARMLIASFPFLPRSECWFFMTSCFHVSTDAVCLPEVW
jgi:hypothetical protein